LPEEWGNTTMETTTFNVKGRVGCVERFPLGEYVQGVYSTVVLTIFHSTIVCKIPDGGLPFCIDCQNINSETIKNRYPLPLIKKTLILLRKA
jgi:hypothetical protein